jgi:hypothetical protein
MDEIEIHRRVMLAASVLAAVDEAHRGPVVVDRAGLVVDEAVVEADRLNRLEGEVGLEAGGLLGVRDPKPVGGIERVAECGEPSLQVGSVRGEEDDDARPGFAPSFRPSGVAE